MARTALRYRSSPRTDSGDAETLLRWRNCLKSEVDVVDGFPPTAASASRRSAPATTEARASVPHAIVALHWHARRQGLERNARSHAPCRTGLHGKPASCCCVKSPGLRLLAIVGDIAQFPVSTGRPQCRGKSLRAPQPSALPRLCAAAPEQFLHGEPPSPGRRSCSSFPAHAK